MGLETIVAGTAVGTCRLGHLPVVFSEFNFLGGFYSLYDNEVKSLALIRFSESASE